MSTTETPATSPPAPPWPKWLRPREAVAYLRDEHGIWMSDKTLANRISQGTGPRCQYFGNWRLTTPGWLDEWAEAGKSDTPWNRRRGQKAA
jgi:hypothetical protein